MTARLNIWPPPPPRHESEEARTARLAAEREAKKISDDIDRAIEADKQERKKSKPHVKVLLLGQAESGKSTMMKNFQMYFTPNAFRAERDAWRTVIHLNLVRFINYLLTALSVHAASGQLGEAGRDHRLFQMRLAPLRQVELILARCLNAEASEVEPTEAQRALWKDGVAPAPEISIRGSSGWKALLKRRRNSGARVTTPEEMEDARKLLYACSEDIVAFCASLAVKALQDCGIDTQHHARFFLDDAERVVDINYAPSEEDILRARLRTLGVEEYRLTMETAAERGDEWWFYDVGGHRGNRATWASHFDDVNTVIFLCPISAFDLALTEDKSINRLHDSVDLWEIICKSKSLANATFVLLLNKCDLLRQKLKSGVMFEDYVSSYRGRPNDVESVAEYLRSQMILTHKQKSPIKRQLHVHLTCAIDTKFMTAVLKSIRDVILLDTLQTSSLL